MVDAELEHQIPIRLGQSVRTRYGERQGGVQVAGAGGIEQGGQQVLTNRFAAEPVTPMTVPRISLRA